MLHKFSSIALATAIVLVSSCDSKKTEGTGADATPTTADSLAVALANQDSLLNLINDVSEGMSQIKSLEDILASTNSLTAESRDKRQQIRDDMMAIQQTLKERRERLAELEQKLKNSSANNATLQRTIDNLKKQIANQESTIETLRNDLSNANIHIEKLTSNVDSLNTTVSEVSAARDAALDEATAMTNELNTCFYAYGSKKELNEHKLIETGFLRKTKILPADFEQSYFTRADKRTLTSIALHSKKAKVMTNQPADSYQIVEDATGMKTLKITNPQAFWTKSNFLVIETD